MSRTDSKPRPKAGARTRGGLVRGTGRLRPNGSIKRSDSNKPVPAAVVPSQQQPTPIRHRTVIDQNPTPLYCSDECRLADLDDRHSGFALDYNPHRDSRQCASPTLPPVPHNSLSNSSDESDGSVSSYSPDSHHGLTAPDYVSVSWESVSPSIAALAKMYDFPALPQRPQEIEAEAKEDARPRHEDEPHPTLEETYVSGVMMAAERIKNTLCAPRPSKSTYGGYPQPAPERKSIPGWTDGSDAWRASVYSLSSPKDDARYDLKKIDERPRAYNSFAASPHRATGVYSTVTDTVAPTPAAPTRASTADDVAKYPLTFARRTASRASVGHPHSLPTTTTRSLVKKGAEGKLLVPNVRLPVRSPSMCTSSDNGSYNSRRSYSQRSVVRSPLSRYGSDLSVSVDEEDERTSEPKTRKRPTVESAFHFLPPV
jgi:hypothetical protein